MLKKGKFTNLIILIIVIFNVRLSEAGDKPYSEHKLENIEELQYNGDINSKYGSISISPNDEWLLYKTGALGKLYAYNLINNVNVLILEKLDYELEENPWLETQKQQQIFILPNDTIYLMPLTSSHKVEHLPLGKRNLVSTNKSYNSSSDIKYQKCIKRDRNHGSIVEVNDKKRILIYPNKDKGKLGHPLSFNVVNSIDYMEKTRIVIKAKRLSWFDRSIIKYMPSFSPQIWISIYQNSIKISPNKRYVAIIPAFTQYNSLGSWSQAPHYHEKELYLIDTKTDKIYLVDDKIGYRYNKEYNTPLVELGKYSVAFTRKSDLLVYVADNKIKALRLE